ncbi:MAG: SxtJ family membrane protein [Gemmatimonadaceae bacterium]
MAAAHPTGLTAPSMPARLSAGEGRRFAFTLATGFAVLGAAAAWRGRQRTAMVLFALAGIAILAALVAPTRLGAVRRGWMALGLALSRLTTPAFYSLLYLLVLTPTGLLRRTIGRSPLARDPASTSYWVPREPVAPDEQRRAMQRQF